MTTSPPHPPRAPIPRYSSKAAYSIPLEDSDAIIKACAYHRKELDLAVISFPPRAHVSIVTSTLSAIRQTTATLGGLDRLPLELINEICLQLDIMSLFRFRQTNTRARQILNALHEYRIITKYASNPLCALLRTQSASRVTLLDFYNLLCTHRCSLCGNRYGDLVFLLTWIRCCSRCLRQGAPEIRVTTAASFKRNPRLSKGSFDRLPKLTTLPGTYTMDKHLRSGRITIIPLPCTLSVYRAENAGSKDAEDMVDKLNTNPIFAFMACCALPSYDSQTGKIESGVSCAGCQVAMENNINSHTTWAGDIRDMVYSRDEFLEHFVWCEPAQLLWLESERGTTEPPK